VLLIDDSRLDRLLIAAALTLKGGMDVKLTEAATLDLGLGLLYQRRYDLVLLDDALPGVSPWDATRAVRGVAPRTPIVRHAQHLGVESAGGGVDSLIEAVRSTLARPGAGPLPAPIPSRAGRAAS
jgi:DNA-binding NarL/FixJ family response regulator